ncbi:MAG: thioredoxin [Candidatus Marinimicrobia bacterium]|nr:thioredoxin [Candidatus Neomarinimicrobiota bacterium]|tara:strand:- start:298 stop:624 length:327 start_codon:yes stop_codon:yes gene_type:complete
MEHFTIDFTDNNFNEEVIKSEEPVLVDFWAEWCGPCKQLTPTIEALAKEYNGKAKIGKVNVDNCPSTAAGYGIRSIPSLLFFKNGKVHQQMVGTNSKEEIAKILDSLI